MIEKWYDKSVKQIENLLGTDSRVGLSRKIAASRIKTNGLNLIYPIPKGSFISYLKHVVTDFTSILLILTAIIAAIFEHNISAVVIIAILLINYSAVIFTYVKAQRVLEDMGHYSLPVAKVMRDGRLYLVNQEQLVQGDIIFVTAGDIVPCDARLIESENLSALEVTLTSVSHAASKRADFIEFRDIAPQEIKNMIFASTILTSGMGKAIVCETGENTLVARLGKNAPIVSHEKLEVLSILKKYCSAWSLCMIAGIFILTIMDLIISFQNNSFGTRSLFDIFLTCLSLAVASMSELYMAFGYIIISCGIFNAVTRYKDVNSGALIKNSAKLETLKDITCLVVPKEGVFCLKDLKVERIYVNNNVYTEDNVKFIDNAASVIRYAVISTALYGGTKLIDNNTNNDNIYSAEEDAIISIADKYALYNVELDKNYPILDHLSIGDNNRFETTIVNCRGNYVVALRGEFSKVLECCRYISENGRIYPLTPDKISEIKISASLIIKEAYRVVAVATKTTIYNNLQKLESCQSDLTFEGFLAVREPTLPGAAVNVEKCRAAGIKVIMLCDDVNKNNRYLAEAVGVAKNYTDIISSEEIIHIKEGLLRANISIYTVYEGLNTTQKRLLLKYLHDEGEVVGMLCKDLDDIILLKECDVGFAQNMTISSKAGNEGVSLTSRRVPIYTKTSKDSSKSGCEALKFISDVIVSYSSSKGDGGFNAVIGAVVCGKVVYQNLLRITKYLITSQSSRLFLVLYSIITNITFITPSQILFCGLITDFAAVIVTAFEQPSSDIMNQPITTSDKLSHPLLHNLQAILFGLFWAVSAIVSITFLHYFGLIAYGAQTITSVFISYILTQMVVLSETKKERSVFIPNVKLNRIHMLLFVSLASIIIISILIPAFGTLFNICVPTFWSCLSAIITPFVMLIIYELYKLITKK